MEKEPILVSACLLGTPCRYDGRSRPQEQISALQKNERFELIPVCPEVLGGLPTPRAPAEIQPDGSVKNAVGADVTAEYTRGAEQVLAIAREKGCRSAILKEKSPACGSGMIYDGSFCRRLIPGDGICAALLRKNGISVLGENQVELAKK